MSKKSASFTHGETAITMTDDGKFSATIGGEEVTKPTLAAIKKAIDAAGGPGAFQPFEALLLHRYSSFEPTLATVTSIGIPRGWRSKPEYRVTLQGGERTTTDLLYKNTQENIELFKALVKRHEEFSRAHKELEKEFEKDKAALVAKLQKFPEPQDNPQYKAPSS